MLHRYHLKHIQMILYPFFIYDSEKVCDGVEHFNERTAKSTGYFIDKGYTLMEEFIDK